MRVIKIVVIFFVIVLLFVLAFCQESDKVNIEGSWKPEKIILNGKIIFPTKLDSLFIGIASTEILINEWMDLLCISNGRNKIEANYIINKTNGNHLIRLSSNMKALNGDFNLKVDTLFLDSVRYQIIVNIERDSTLINFQRIVQIKPWEIWRPVRGIP